VIGAPIRRRVERSLKGCDAATLFAVAADIERYPEFVPGCLAARVVERRPDLWIVDNSFSFGPARSDFRSRAAFDPPHGLTISSEDGPWREFRLAWGFGDERGGCRLTCAMTLDFRSPMLAALATLAAPGLERDVVAAFETRARRVSQGRPT